MQSNKEKYSNRVPEQFNIYSPTQEKDTMPDIDSVGIIRDIGVTTGLEGRENHIRQDGNSSDLNNVYKGLTQATEAMLEFLKEKVKPIIVVNNEIIPVPVLYVNSEKWVSIQKNGYIKDEKGKSLAPVIAVRRTNIDDKVISKLNGIRSYGNEISYYKQHSSLNRYDNFAILNNQQPVKEIYSVPIPEWWRVEYELSIWTELIVHMDKLIEDIYIYKGSPIGGNSKYRYRSDITSISAPETSNGQGEDRLVKSTINFELMVPITQKETTDGSTINKNISIGKVLFKNETIL